MTAGILSLSLEPRGTCSGAGKGAMRRPILPNSSALSVVNSVATFLNSLKFLNPVIPSLIFFGPKRVAK